MNITNLFFNRVLFTILLLFASIAFSSIAAVETNNPKYYGKVKGYLAKPKANGNYPALILIHEWWGLNEDIKKKAEEFAKAGYIALAVDLYNGESTNKPEKARKLAGSVRKDIKGAFANLNAAFDFLKNNPQVDNARLASVGWCFGGGWSYQIAKNNLGAKVSVIYYGRFNPEDDLSQMRANIIGHFAEKDRGIKLDNVKEFQVKLKTISGDHEVYIYPNTGHGFANPKNPVYDKEAADLAQQRTLEFLEENL